MQTAHPGDLPQRFPVRRASVVYYPSAPWCSATFLVNMPVGTLSSRGRKGEAPSGNPVFQVHAARRRPSTLNQAKALANNQAAAGTGTGAGPAAAEMKI